LASQLYREWTHRNPCSFEYRVMLEHRLDQNVELRTILKPERAYDSSIQSHRQIYLSYDIQIIVLYEKKLSELNI
jgi:hypothetical protein